MRSTGQAGSTRFFQIEPMIKFALKCSRGHAFEGWFPDGADFDAQSERGQIECPQCQSTEVVKAPMAPAVLAQRQTPTSQSSTSSGGDEARQVRDAMRALRKQIEANTQDVGKEFPEEAREIHAGRAPERAIRGQATLSEAKELLEEGIGVLPLPPIADELN